MVIFIKYTVYLTNKLKNDKGLSETGVNRLTLRRK
jgi:hypothetical protein